MGTRWPETCWATYKGEINIILKVTSSWSLYPHYCFEIYNSLHMTLRNLVDMSDVKYIQTNYTGFMFLWPCIVSKAWRKNTNKMQQYRWFIVNSRCWLLTTVSTYFGHLYAHHQEKRPRVTAYGVYLLVVLDVAGCGTVVLRCRVWALWRLL